MNVLMNDDIIIINRTAYKGSGVVMEIIYSDEYIRMWEKIPIKGIEDI